MRGLYHCRDEQKTGRRPTVLNHWSRELANDFAWDYKHPWKFAEATWHGRRCEGDALHQDRQLPLWKLGLQLDPEANGDAGGSAPAFPRYKPHADERTRGEQRSVECCSKATAKACWKGQAASAASTEGTYHDSELGLHWRNWQHQPL